MSITSALFSGTSGLATNGAALAVIGNNIANLNTVGFKGSRSEFEDILSQGLVGASTSSQIGRGVELANVRQIFTQGSFQATNSETDLAIDGDGFFILRQNSNRTYTRAGMFSLDKDNKLVNPDNKVVQGRMGDTEGTIIGSMTDINFSSKVTAPANDTDNVSIVANVDSRGTVPATAFTLNNGVISSNNATNASNFATTLTVFDSIGADHTMTIFFRKRATPANSYDFHIMANASDITAGSTGFARGGVGSIAFSNGGTVSTVSGAIATFTFLGANSTGISFDFNSITQFASAAATTFQSQDGFSSGSLLSFAIGADGTITGNYSNGEAITLAQLSMARFDNPDGLTGVGGNQFAESGTSGQPIIGEPSSGGRGSISSNSLELSNVDLADEFVKLITTQRAFQASSRTITLTDELLAELVNLIR